MSDALILGPHSSMQVMYDAVNRLSAEKDVLTAERDGYVDTVELFNAMFLGPGARRP